MYYFHLKHFTHSGFQRYQEAAEHILDALVLQENDGLERGVTSSALWETLRNVCLNLHRHDLANICNRRDLNSESLQVRLWQDAHLVQVSDLRSSPVKTR